jgi:hypothetical protein
MDKELLGICVAVLILCVPTAWEAWLTHREKMARINKGSERGPIESDDQGDL